MDVIVINIIIIIIMIIAIIYIIYIIIIIILITLSSGQNSRRMIGSTAFRRPSSTSQIKIISLITAQMRGDDIDDEYHDIDDVDIDNDYGVDDEYAYLDDQSCL